MSFLDQLGAIARRGYEYGGKLGYRRVARLSCGESFECNVQVKRGLMPMMQGGRQDNRTASLLADVGAIPAGVGRDAVVIIDGERWRVESVQLLVGGFVSWHLVRVGLG